MKNTKFLIIFFSILIFTACDAAGPNVVPPNDTNAEPPVEEPDAKEPTEEQPAEKPAVELPDPEYLTYSEELYNELLGKEPFVLFFHASWGPISVELGKSIKEDLANFPKGTKILQTDFDTESELKEKYGIEFQTNFVIINAQGEAVETLAAPTLEELKIAITEAL